MILKFKNTGSFNVIVSERKLVASSSIEATTLLLEVIRGAETCSTLGVSQYLSIRVSTVHKI